MLPGEKPQGSGSRRDCENPIPEAQSSYWTVPRRQGTSMTTLRSGTASGSAGARSVICRHPKAVAVGALLLGTTAMFEPTPAQAGFGGILSHAMSVYGGHYGGGYRSRGGRHSRRDRDSSRHASRHHRGSR